MSRFPAFATRPSADEDLVTDLGLRRSWALLRAFGVEQTEPDVFYGLLAADSVATVRRFTSLHDRWVLDVGAGPVQFARAFARAGARYVGVDADESEIAPAGTPGTAAIVARGERLPLRSESVDVAFSSNVLEHVRAPWRLADELVRVTKPGGLIVICYTNWLSPWGGHETSPYHYLGGRRAVRRYTRRYGRPPKNRVGENLFVISVGSGLAWARNQPDVELLEARPRYYPDWMRPLLRLPGLREIATWNLLLVLRRR
jgi:SAM-dependent methyltransferase